jgi:hypothetical protein
MLEREVPRWSECEFETAADQGWGWIRVRRSGTGRECLQVGGECWVGAGVRSRVTSRGFCSRILPAAAVRGGCVRGLLQVVEREV